MKLFRINGMPINGLPSSVYRIGIVPGVGVAAECTSCLNRHDAAIEAGHRHTNLPPAGLLNTAQDLGAYMVSHERLYHPELARPREMVYVIWSVHHQGYYRHGGYGYHPDVDRAQRFTLEQALPELEARAFSASPDSAYALVAAPENWETGQGRTEPGPDLVNNGAISRPFRPPWMRHVDTDQQLHPDRGIVLGTCAHWWQAATTGLGTVELLEYAGHCPHCGRKAAVVVGNWEEIWPEPAELEDIAPGPRDVPDQLPDLEGYPPNSATGRFLAGLERPAPDAGTVAALAEDDAHARAERHMERPEELPAETAGGGRHQTLRPLPTWPATAPQAVIRPGSIAPAAPVLVHAGAGCGHLVSRHQAGAGCLDCPCDHPTGIA